MNADSIDEVLGQDHERLGALLEHARKTILARSPEASNAFASLSRDLLRHMRWEDDLLFPAVAERANSTQRRSIESLGIDHERLRETLHDLESSLVAGDFDTAATSLDWLETLLKGHNYDEEHGVYVEADGYLDADQRRRLIDAFRSGPT